MSAITAKASRKMKKYAVLTREPRCFLGSFDFSWEQRKAKELCNIGTGKSNTQDQVEDGIYPFYIRSDIPVKSNKYLYDCEAVITIGDGNIGRVFHYVNGKFDLHQRCYKMTDFQDIWGKYFYYFFSTRFYDRAMKMTAKATVDSVRLEMISEMDIWKPTAIDEQKKIAEFFANLDNLITLHQRKCVFLFGLFQASISMIFTASTFSWEQRKLGDIASDMVAGGDIDKDLILAEGQYPVIANALTGDGIVGYYDKEYRVNAPAVTVTGRGDVGHAKARLVNFTPVVRLLSVKSEHDVFFLENAINTLKIVIESTGVPQLTVPQLAKYEVAFPRQLDEEEHIGVFFKQLDHLITLHQRECISFTVRAGGLILTANKKRTTSSWEQRKAVDIADYSKGNGYSKSDLTENGTPIILYGRLYTKYQFAIDEVDTFATPKDGSIYSQGNEVIIPASGETAEDIARASAVEKSGILLGGDLNILRPFNFINPLFLALTISNGEPQKELAKKAQGKSVVHIHNSDIQEVTVSFPTRAEQDRIVAVFRSLDNLITLHQRKPFLMKWRTSDANRNQTNRLVL